MDFLESLDLDTTHQKSDRVRSWYLYEQFKALERNQLDAAQKLKDRSYQEKILRRELSERKARRKLYDQFGLCESESRIGRSIKNDSGKTSLVMSVGKEDFYETFSQFQDEDVIHVNEQDVSEDGFSQDDSVQDKSCMEDFRSVEDLRECNSRAESITSVIENVQSNETITEHEHIIDYSAMTLAQDIGKQFEEVRENIQCLENLTKLEDDEKVSEDGSEIFIDELKQSPVDVKSVHEYENNLIAVWSRLVSFAYQVVQLNRGNCYYDYSSQLLTAVLACDVLRRGVSRMCHILQPYVSPIKFAIDEPDLCSESCKNMRRKKIVLTKNYRKTLECQLCPNKTRTMDKKYTNRRYSDDCWQHFSRRSLEKRVGKRRRASEPWRSVFNKDVSPSCSTLWRDFSRERLSELSQELCSCCSKRTVNPMLKIASYIDNLLKDIDLNDM